MITQLTQEQEEQIQVYREKWIKIGLDTQRINHEEATKIINSFYTEILNKEPVPVIYAKSPLDAWKKVEEVTGGEEKDFIWPYMDGSFFASTLSFYDYLINCAKVDIDEDLLRKFQIWKNMAYVSLVYSLDHVCVVSEKPIEIHMENGRLHNESGPSILYEDGFSVYSLNGIRVPKWVVETPAKDIPVKKILEEKNVEIRRELIRKVGIQSIYENTNHTKIDTQDSYELIELDLGGITARYLKMNNPSVDAIHLEGVPMECDSVKKALAWRNGQWEVGQDFDNFIEPEVLT